MKCPYCAHEESKVLDSRPVEDGAGIRRRRECLQCGRRFTTYERMDHVPVMVVKRDGRREPFDRAKIMKG
ncbi:MAG TPA: transcriptional regulator NrdR, partial [bacterium]|nr:transcriptional regulator NrdR [bacterium]